MKIYEVAVRKPVSTILIFVGMIVFGLFSLSRLAIDMYPEIEIPSVMVITAYPGANASDIETNISRVLEDNLNTVNNLKKITSKSQDNISVVTLEFNYGNDMTEAANDVRDAIGRVQSLLPDDVETPTILKINSSMIPVMVLTATARESYAALYKILDERLINTLNRVNGVGAVSVSGQPIREVQVNIDPRRLEAFNLSVEQIGAVIAAENVNVPGGMIDLGNFTFSVKADGEFTDSDQLQDVVITNIGGKDILLRDVATVRDTLRTATMDSRVNGERGVSIYIQKQSGANSVAIVDKVMAELEGIKKTLPPDVEIGIVMDTSESIRDSISSLTETVMFAFLFVTIVVLFFLGRWRATLIICITIPVSLIVSFIYLYLTGGTINIISLSSLSIAIGMVVDDAIVVLENITKHIERGSSPREAAIYGTNEVWIAVIATTLTIIAVFLPLTMISGMAGIMFRQLGWIVTLTITVSVIAAITITPLLASKWLTTYHAGRKGISRIFNPVGRMLDRLDVSYAKMLTWTVRHKTVTIVGSAVIFVASLGLMSLVPTELFTPTDDGYITGTVKLEQNIGVNFTSRIAHRIDSIFMAQYPEINIITSSAGASSGEDAFEAVFQESGSYIITFMVRLPRASERDRSIFQIAELMRQDLAGFPEIREFQVTPGSGMGGGMGSSSTLDLKVFGYDFDQTDALSRELLAKMKELDGTRDVYLSRDDLRPEYNVVFDRKKLAFYGLNSSTASLAIRNRVNGLTATQYREDGEEYDVIVRYEERFRETPEDIANIMVTNSRGEQIRIGDVGEVREELAPPAIQRENRQRVVTVHSALADGVALGTVVKQVQEMLPTVEVPNDVFVEIGGSYEDQQESFADILVLFPLIVLLVYIVMATQFESLRMPFINMITVLFAFTGVFLALLITNTPLSMVALIGAIMLVGIVVKNGIVMVDFMNLLRERGNSVYQSVIEGGKSRLRPVLMTSAATILGMLPLAINIGEGSEMWRPMGVAIIGGLTFSTLLTLFVVPALYASFGYQDIRRGRQQNAERIREKKRLRKENN